MIKKRKLAVIFSAGFFIVTLLAGFLTASYVYTNLSNVLLNRSFAQLQTISNLKTANARILIQTYKDRASGLSSAVTIQDDLYKIKNSQGGADTIKSLVDYFKTYKLPAWQLLDSISILNEKGTLIGSTDSKSAVGSDMSADPLFLEGRSAPYMSDLASDGISGKNYFLLSTPINRNNEFVGILVYRFPANELFNIVGGDIGFGTAGESYIINKDSYLITPSPFLHGANAGILTQFVDSVNSKKCKADVKEYLANSSLNHTAGDNFVSFLDFRGVVVDGRHDIIPEMNWCLLTEVDKDAIWNGQKMNIIIISILILSAIVICASALGFLIGHRLENNCK